MNRINPILLTLTLLFAFAGFPAHAETLTDQKVRSFISSLEAIQGMEDDYEDLPDDLAGEDSTVEMEDMSRMFSASIEKMKGHRIYNDLKGRIQQHGFSSPEQWGETGDRIFNAWGALQMGQQSGQMNQGMARAMEEMENNPNMSEAQKQQMREMMGGAMSAMDHLKNVSEADKRAVRPHMEALRAITVEEADL
jgi:hypothetical protein